jgi:ApaG protein
MTEKLMTNKTSTASTSEITVKVITEYLASQLIENEINHVFSYTITITNNSSKAVKLLSRYWLITDADNKTSTVTGEGVIGKQPTIAPQKSFTYSSGCILKTPVGTMEGHYQMLDEDNNLSQIKIPVFGLAKAELLH